jgi:thiol-disulfide isomerase/thioredoxin
MACAAAAPIVDGLEQEFEGQLVVIRVDIQSQAGSQLTSRFGSRVSPTFIFFDAVGNEMWRSFGSIDADQVRAALATP